MREQFLKEIEELSIKEDGFPKTSTKWWLFTCGKDKIHISEFDFNECTDEELTKLYNKILKNCNKA